MSVATYRANPMWADLTPVPQCEPADSPVAIAYSLAFTETMDFFRAALKADERSERTLALTEDVIQQNSANYTAWAFRRQILHSLCKDLRAELCWCERVARDAPKNYQLWHHRRSIIETIQDKHNEMALTESILEGDSKNYHVWSHRQWLIQRFALHADDRAFSERIIEKDVKNNSAWNHRFFLLEGTGAFDSEAAIAGELSFVHSAIARLPDNEAAWNYMGGIVRKIQANQQGKQEGAISADALHRIIHECSSFADTILSSSPLNRFALSALVDLAAPQSAALCQRLASEADTVRAEYWKYRKERLPQLAHQ